MKKILLLFCLTYSLCLSAQKIHFTDPSNEWKSYLMGWGYAHGAISTFGISNWYAYSYHTDTFLAGKTYKQMGLFVREDTIAKKVFYINPPDSEKVLLDYNLQVGDSFNFGFYTSSVASIDSLLINNVWHKVWHFNFCHAAPPLYVIEGIGTSNGPRSFTTPGGSECSGSIWAVEQLYCFSNSGIFQSSHLPDYLLISNGCPPPLLAEELKPHASDIILYPVPATNALFIESPEKITGITISNLLGQTIFNKAFNDKKAEIDVERFPAGIYFITINKTITRKFIKK